MGDLTAQALANMAWAFVAPVRRQMVAEFASMGLLLALSNPPVVISVFQLKTALLVTGFILPVD